MPGTADERLSKLHRNYVEGQRLFAWILIVVGVAAFISNLLGTEAPPSSVLGGATLAAVVGGIGWLYSIRREIEKLEAILRQIERE